MMITFVYQFNNRYYKLEYRPLVLGVTKCIIPQRTGKVICIRNRKRLIYRCTNFNDQLYNLEKRIKTKMSDLLGG